MSASTDPTLRDLETDAVAAEASGDVWRSFHQRVNRFLRARVPREDAEDIEQEVFLRIHRSLAGGTVPHDLSGWVHQIARHAVIDHYRRRGADPVQLTAQVEDDRAVDPLGLDDVSAVAELAACLRPLIDDLPPAYRDALTMTALDGRTQVDAARAAGVSVSGMKSRVQRGRKMLASKVLSCCAVEFDGRGAPLECVRRGC